jgi:hypothetical protein
LANARKIDQQYRKVFQNHVVNQRAIIHNQKVAEENKEQPLFVEKLTDNILLEIPEIMSMELPAILSAIYYFKKTAFDKNDAWSSMRKNYRRDLTLNMDIICETPEVQEIVIKTLGLRPCNVCLDRPEVYTYDMYHRFAPREMQSFRDNSKFHAASAYGIGLGCEALSLFEIPINDIIVNVEGRTAVDILVIDNASDVYKNVWEWIGTNAPDLTVSRLVSSENTFSGMMAAIHDAKLVVGSATSMYPYFACCLMKPVFEFYPTNISRNWLSKWSNPNYSMYVTDEPDKIKTLQGVSNLWIRSKQRTP